MRCSGEMSLHIGACYRCLLLVFTPHAHLPGESPEWPMIWGAPLIRSHTTLSDISRQFAPITAVPLARGRRQEYQFACDAIAPWRDRAPPSPGRRGFQSNSAPSRIVVADTKGERMMFEKNRNVSLPAAALIGVLLFVSPLSAQSRSAGSRSGHSPITGP